MVNSKGRMPRVAALQYTALVYGVAFTAFRDRLSGMPSLVAILLALLLAACGSSERTEEAAVLEALDKSEAQWLKLEASSGDSYWYVETSCGQGMRDTTTVQVLRGIATAVTTERADESRCLQDEPYRYEDFSPTSILELHAECRELISDYATTVTFDGEGIIESCRAIETDCRDACDHGFHIDRRGFGKL
jgi:hypothetical protein